RTAVCRCPTGRRGRRLLLACRLPFERRALPRSCPPGVAERAAILRRPAGLGGRRPAARGRFRRGGAVTPEPAVPAPPPGHPYAQEIEAERRGWYEMAALVRLLTPEECLEP